jgi:hypothetical protein
VQPNRPCGGLSIGAREKSATLGQGMPVAAVPEPAEDEIQ